MMNLEAMSDHNICGSSFARSESPSTTISRSQGRSERGYTLVALLALMSVVALFAMAVAPRVSQQAQRDREVETIYRGEQVAEAIRLHYRWRLTQGRPPGDQALPSSMEDLLDGIPIPGGAKNRQILRASAARDPLTLEGEWRFIGPRTQGLVEFQQSILFYTGSFVPPPRDAQMAQLQQFAVPPITSIPKIGEKPESSSSSSLDDVSSGPFVGVASRSRKDSVLTYYGIERHDQWIFTPLFRN
jgi:type II secretory pathway pseudopilin PulG